MMLMAKAPKFKLNKWDNMKIKDFGMAKETIAKTKRQQNKWENNVFVQHSCKGLLPRIYKTLNKCFIKIQILSPSKMLRGNEKTPSLLNGNRKIASEKILVIIYT